MGRSTKAEEDEMGNCAIGYGPMNSPYHLDDSVLSSRQLNSTVEINSCPDAAGPQKRH